MLVTHLFVIGLKMPYTKRSDTFKLERLGTPLSLQAGREPDGDERGSPVVCREDCEVKIVKQLLSRSSVKMGMVMRRRCSSRGP